MERVVYTIGYGNRTIEAFVALLVDQGITAVADVRSTPFSRFNPAFNRAELQQALADRAIRYVFLGEQLGARPEDDSLYIDGRASYPRMAASAPFQAGIDRIEAGLAQFTVAIMCAELEPLDCHRAILVSPALVARGVTVRHVRKGSVETHDALEQRLLVTYGMDQADLFNDTQPEGALATAYRRRGHDLAYQRPV